MTSSDSRKTLVIADDEELTRVFLSTTLSGQGFEVLLAEDGAKAFELVEQNHVQLIVSDIHMPRMDGLKLLEKLRGSRHVGVPVILITADGDSFTEAQAQGATVLRKPFRRRELVELINSVLDRKPA